MERFRNLFIREKVIKIPIHPVFLEDDEKEAAAGVNFAQTERSFIKERF